MITFNEFLQKVDETFASNQGKNKWRYGQTVINVLYDVWKEKCKEITNTPFDCFYKDSVVKSTLDKLEKEWTE